MKLSKELEKEVRKEYIEYWDCYMKGDSRKISRFLDRNIKMMGTTEGEVFNNKKEAVNFFKTTAGEVAGKIAMRNRIIDIVPLQDLILINELMDLYVLSRGEWVFYSKVRLSSLMQQQKTGWKIIQQHGSMPDARTQEGETIAFERITKENLALRDAVNRRTVELENKSRALEIESSLERVRTVAMGMKAPEDMLDVCRVISTELQGLGIKEIRNVQTAIIDEEKASYLNYEYFRLHKKTCITTVEYKKQKDVNAFVKKMLKDPEGFFTKNFKGAELKDWMQYQAKAGQFVDPQLKKTNSLHYYFYSIGPGALGISAYAPLTKEGISLFKQFRNVFLLAYRRFLDIQKAVAQAREAKIELGLERVRARAMTMQESDELTALVATVFKELTRLDFTLTSCIIWIHDPGTVSNTLWIASAGLNKLAKPYLVQPFHHDFFRSINHAWKAKDPKWVYTLTGPEKKNFEKAFFKEIPDLPEALRKALKIPRQVVFSASFNNFGALEIVETVALTAEKFEILHRFGNVFNTSYTRFNDLKKAEAQAREAQIEAALERVRARALAMHKSEELKEVALELRNQMGLIGQKNLEVCAIHLYEEDEKYFESWFAIRPPGDEKKLYQGHSRFPKKGIKIVDEMMQRYAEGSKDYDIVNEGEKAVEWFGILRENEPEAYALISQSFGNTPIHQLKAYWAIADFSGGSLIMVTYSRADETSRNLLRRSANVFEMAYTRFLDLKKAEAQAREAKIEAALEKVRAKVMAMNSSKDLTDTSLVFGEQLRKLGIDWQFSYFWLIETDKDENTFWITWPDNKTSTTTYSLAEADESFRECIIAWQRQDKIHASFIAPEAIAEWLHTFERITADAGGAALEIMQPGNFKEGVYYYDAMIRFGSFGILTNRPINDEEKNIQSRFAVEFERAYTRFLDLQKAEAQAREARIEAALERVRSRTMAMQHSDELKDAANLLFRQVKDLGIHAWSAGYGTWLDGYKACTLYMSSEDQMQVPFIYPHTEDPVSIRFAEGAEKGLALYVEEMGGEALASHYRYMRSLPLVGEMLEEIRKAGFDVPRFQVFHVAYYSHGYLLFITYEPVPEAHTIFKRFGNVFEQTYTRFLDLQQKEEQAMRLREEKMKLEQTLAALQATQKQLIQAEKMASLGELTAGIAHEIQNPLNFVTNFSEVSNELIQEMVEEVEKGNYKEAKEIAGDVMQNLEKINFHGKRADGIVKGMLQHSRNSSGTREPTDINALADEYLRLSYHGLRAKDKSFHAKLEADFDATIEKVNVMPQDLGRVILNLINNAFYAVDEKKKQSENGYEPTVSINTKKLGDKIEIKVKDNGNGIPRKIMDKIFQPFFTTKPTGQGTGLGLSLAYDIIKAHGGEIKVDTKEGEGTEFIINLPVNQ